MSPDYKFARDGVFFNDKSTDLSKILAPSQSEQCRADLLFASTALRSVMNLWLWAKNLEMLA